MKLYLEKLINFPFLCHGRLQRLMLAEKLYLIIFLDVFRREREGALLQGLIMKNYFLRTKKSAEENFARIYDFNFGICVVDGEKSFLIFRKSCVGENGASDEETSPRNPINVDLFSIIFAFDDKFPAINLELRERKKCCV